MSALEAVARQPARQAVGRAASFQPRSIRSDGDARAGWERSDARGARGTARRVRQRDVRARARASKRSAGGAKGRPEAASSTTPSGRRWLRHEIRDDALELRVGAESPSLRRPQRAHVAHGAPHSRCFASAAKRTLSSRDSCARMRSACHGGHET